jgi:hypothetical protein
MGMKKWEIRAGKKRLGKGEREGTDNTSISVISIIFSF